MRNLDVMLDQFTEKEGFESGQDHENPLWHKG